MRRWIIILLAALAVIAGWYLIADLYPKYSARYPWFLVLIGADIYLFIRVRRSMPEKGVFTKTLLIILWWLPAFLLLMLLAVSAFKPYYLWPKPIKVYLPGVIFVGFAFKLLPLVLFLISDIIRAIRSTLSGRKEKNRKEATAEGLSRRKFLRNSGLLLGSLMAGGLIYGMTNIYRFRVHRQKIRFPDLPRPFSGLRIVQISDVHLGSWISGSHLEEAVEIINSLNPDLFFFTGDLVDYSTDEAYPFEPILRKIKARYGKFAVLGNHDYGDYRKWESEKAKRRNMREMIALNRRLGWKLLMNDHANIRRGAEEITIVGVENWGAVSRFPRYGSLEKALTGARDNGFRILLSHDPSHWSAKVVDFPSRFDLTLSGHTHGFQMGIDIPGFRWSPAQYVYAHWAGLYEKRKEQNDAPYYLYVNRGIGSIGYPGRLGIDPEITLIELIH